MDVGGFGGRGSYDGGDAGASRLEELHQQGSRFSFFMAPGEVKAAVGNFRGNVAGPRQTIVYRSVEDNIEYKVTVMSFLQAQAEGATLLGEREYMFQDGKKVLMDTFARVEPGKDAVYGRKIVVDLPDNKGRTTGAFYFTKGRLIALEATVLPANGDFASPDPGRFIDSIVFVLVARKTAQPS